MRWGRRQATCCLIVAAHEDIVNASLSALRTELGSRLELTDANELAYAFVTEFPLFEAAGGGGRELNSVHHPFTSLRRRKTSACLRNRQHQCGHAPTTSS